MDIDLQKLNCTPSASLITHGQVTQLVRPFCFSQSLHCYFPAVGKLPINIQETCSHFIFSDELRSSGFCCSVCWHI